MKHFLIDYEHLCKNKPKTGTMQFFLLLLFVLLSPWETGFFHSVSTDNSVYHLGAKWTTVLSVIAVLPYYYISRALDNIFYYFVVIALYSILYSFMIRGLLWAGSCLFADQANYYIYLFTHPAVINVVLSCGFFVYLLRHKINDKEENK